ATPKPVFHPESHGKQRKRIVRVIFIFEKCSSLHERAALCSATPSRGRTSKPLSPSKPLTISNLNVPPPFSIRPARPSRRGHGRHSRITQSRQSWNPSMKPHRTRSITRSNEQNI